MEIWLKVATGRKSNATGFVESVFAAPYPTSFRSGAGFGFATSR